MGNSSNRQASNDPRFIRTGAELKEAFLRLIAIEDFDSISILRICKTAKINRSTFYLHYSDKYELLEECILDLLKPSSDDWVHAEDFTISSKFIYFMKKIAIKCLDHKALFTNILNSGRYPAFYAIFSKSLVTNVGSLVELVIQDAGKSAKDMNVDQVLFISSAYFGSLMHWAQYGSLGRVDDFCASIAQFTYAVINAQELDMFRQPNRGAC